MSVQLAIANIALDTASVSRQGFGTILFVGKHNYFSERTRSYASTKAMQADDIPTTSGIYIAAQGAFSQSPKPTKIMIGRQETTTVLTPTTPVNGMEYKVTLNANAATAAAFSYTAAVGADDAEAVVDALKTAIDADADIAAKITTTKVGTGTAAVLELSQTVSGTDWFVVSLLTNLVETFKAVSTETAAATIAAISNEDDDYYYLTAEDKSNTFILAAGADIESKVKVYRTSISEVASYAATPTGTAKDLVTAKLFRTSCFYHHEATTKFPEVAALAEIAFATTGTVTYANRIVRAVSPSLNADSKPLNTTQQGKLKTIDCDYIARVGQALTDPAITVIGKVAGNEWLDNIVTRDNMQVDIQADFTNFFIQQKASKVAFNSKGLNQCRDILASTLDQYTTEGIHNFIEPDYVITVADILTIPTADKAARTLKQLTFVATLTGAIQMTEITGTLTL